MNNHKNLLAQTSSHSRPDWSVLAEGIDDTDVLFRSLLPAVVWDSAPDDDDDDEFFRSNFAVNKICDNSLPRVSQTDVNIYYTLAATGIGNYLQRIMYIIKSKLKIENGTITINCNY